MVVFHVLHWLVSISSLFPYRYELDPSFSMNATQLPANQAYYQFGPSGLSNLTKTSGFPFFCSKPHFLDCDPSLLDPVTGLSPNREQHDTFLDLEPYTGTCLRSYWRQQMVGLLSNWGLPKVSDLLARLLVASMGFGGDQQLQIQDCLVSDQQWQVPSQGIYLPTTWFIQSAEVPQSMADDIKNTVYLSVDMMDGIGFWGLVAAGVLLVMRLLTIELGHVRR